MPSQPLLLHQGENTQGERDTEDEVFFTRTNSHSHVQILAWLCQVQPSIYPFAASGHNFPDWIKKCEPPEPQKHSWNTQGEWDMENEVLHRPTQVLAFKFWPDCVKSNCQSTPLLPQAIIFQTEL